MSDRARTRPGGRSARIRAAVFAATLRLLEAQGYESLSLTSIASDAGVHEATLYRRWKTKEQLVLAAVTSQIAEDISVPDTGALRSDLVSVLRSLQTFLQSAVGQALIQTAVATLHDPELCALRQEHWRQRRLHLQVIFDRAVARRELAPQTNPQLLLETLIGIFYVRVFVVNEPLTETLPKQVVDLVLADPTTGGTAEYGAASL